MPKLPDTIENAVQLRGNDKAGMALKMLRRLLKKQPDNAVLNYQTAWTCDTLGLEREAVPYYEQALVLGLDGEDLRGALLGLGSTYRALGEYDKAVATCEAGLEFFPDGREFQVFLALALYNLGKPDQAMTLLLRNLAETSNDAGIVRYRQAILFYSDKLDETWGREGR